MKLLFGKNIDGLAAEVAALKSQLESAKRRITDLTLDNIQQANEIVILKGYRGAPDGQGAMFCLAAANCDRRLVLDLAAS
jgi:uncharacterized caspase-like protein